MKKAIEVLEARLAQLEEEYKRERAELEQAIANLQRAGTQGPNGSRSSGKTGKAVKIGRWKGMGITDSIHAYLSYRDGPEPFSKVLEALQAGGVQLGDPEKPNRFAANVKTTIINNRKRFRYNRNKDTVELRPG